MAAAAAAAAVVVGVVVAAAAAGDDAAKDAAVVGDGACPVGMAGAMTVASWAAATAVVEVETKGAAAGAATGRMDEGEGAYAGETGAVMVQGSEAPDGMGATEAAVASSDGTGPCVHTDEDNWAEWRLETAGPSRADGDEGNVENTPGEGRDADGAGTEVDASSALSSRVAPAPRSCSTRGTCPWGRRCS